VLETRQVEPLGTNQTRSWAKLQAGVAHKSLLCRRENARCETTQFQHLGCSSAKIVTGLLAGAQRALLTTRRNLIGIFERFGFRIMGLEIEDNIAGPLVPMEFRARDVSHLRATRSCLLDAPGFQTAFDISHGALLWPPYDGIIADGLDGFQRHVTGSLDRLFVVLFEQDSADEAPDGGLVWEDADDVDAQLDLTVEAFDRIGGVQLGPMRGWIVHECEYIRLTAQ